MKLPLFWRHCFSLLACALFFAALPSQKARGDGTNQAIFPWGTPQFTDGNLNTYPRPSWASIAGMDGGLWITNDTWYGWQPALGAWQPELATNRLFIHLDRSLMTSNLWLAVAGTGESNATLLAGFYDADMFAVTEPAVLHVSSVVPWPAMSAVEWYTNTVDLSGVPSASILAFSASNGMMRIFCSVLYQEGRTTVLDGSADSSPAQVQGRGQETDLGEEWASTNNHVRILPVLPGPGSHLPQRTSEPRSGPRTWYVDKVHGDDTLHDGTAAIHVAATAIGPKKSVAKALLAAVPGDTICVSAGVYPEHVRLDGIRLITRGRVDFQ